MVLHHRTVPTFATWMTKPLRHLRDYLEKVQLEAVTFAIAFDDRQPPLSIVKVDVIWSFEMSPNVADDT